MSITLYDILKKEPDFFSVNETNAITLRKTKKGTGIGPLLNRRERWWRIKVSVTGENSLKCKIQRLWFPFVWMTWKEYDLNAGYHGFEKDSIFLMIYNHARDLVEKTCEEKYRKRINKKSFNL